ncbi:MAG TPA: site-specific integrase [Candidatus Acidoferrales bacterium]|nr:site-specific integrase [Candidatus Acidoferrales bacterium]
MSVFKRGRVYWFEFVFNGERIQRSTKQLNRQVAVDIESAFRTSLAKGEVGIKEPKQERRTVGDLLDALHEKYELDGKLSSQNRSMISRVRNDFGSKRATELTAEDITKYVKARSAAGAANATVNRVTEILSRCYALAELPAPKMHALPENNARKGFFTATEMESVLANLPDDGLRDFVRFGYITGMRKGEIESLRWDNLEKDGVLKLAAEDAKTGEARTVPCDQGELGQIIERRKGARSFKNSEGHITLSQVIFHRGDGEPIGEFRKSWKTACVAAGVGHWVKRGKSRSYEGRIFHDLRRSAIRDLVRAGVGQAVAMTISGHRTVSVFQRYNITDEDDKRAALTAAAKYREEQKKAVVAIAKG